MMHGISRQTERAGQTSLPPRHLDGCVSRGPCTMRFVAHAESVEYSSTPCKRECSDLLNIQPGRIPACSRTMDAAQNKMDVGARLRIAREALGFGLRPFARAVGIDPTKLNHWEHGKHYPDPLYVRLLWDRYGVTADWIYLGRVSGVGHALAADLLAASSEKKPAHSL